MIIKVKVKTKTSQRKVEKLAAGSYQVYLHSAPVDNQANDELVGLLAEEFKVKKYQVEIVKGLTAKNKVINIQLEHRV